MFLETRTSPRFFAISQNGERIDHYLFQDLRNAVIAWGKCDPGCEIVELNPKGRIVKTFSAEEIGDWLNVWNQEGPIALTPDPSAFDESR